MQTEYVTLKRTEEILKKKFDSVKEHLPHDERNVGMEADTGKNLKNRAEELMSKKELSSKMSQKKADLAPILKELKQIREAIDVRIIFIKNVIKL